MYGLDAGHDARQGERQAHHAAGGWFMGVLIVGRRSPPGQNFPILAGRAADLAVPLRRRLGVAARWRHDGRVTGSMVSCKQLGNRLPGGRAGYYLWVYSRFG